MADDTKELLKALRAQGWRVEQGKRHYLAFPPEISMGLVVIASTPSDRRGFANTISELRKRGFSWNGW